MNSLLFDIGMATAPITGYVMQYRMIFINKSVGAFSIDICFVLLFANILRVNFFLFEHYEIALLFQSFFMITAQVLLLKICTKYREQNNSQMSSEALDSNKGKEEDQNQDFWRWKKFQSYSKRIIWFAIWTILFSIIMKIIGLNIYGDFVGLIALLSQSVLILPQIIQIFKQKRAGGISYSLVSLNFIGDIIKLYYFIVKSQAFQFKLCGGIQLILDVFVIFQIAYFQWGQGMTELNEDNGQLDLPKKSDNIILDENRADQLEGSLSRTAQLEEHVQDIQKQNSKDSQTE